MTTRFAVVRDVLLLLIGTAGVIHQEFVRDASDSALLLFYAAIFGLTAFLPNGVADSIRNNRVLPAPAPAPPEAPDDAAQREPAQ